MKEELYMNFLEYSNENQVNIIPKESYEGLVHSVFRVVADNMAKSLGPLGSSTIIMDGMLTEATKDGYAIFKNIRFHNRYKKMIYNLIKAPCTKLNNTVGDGTTTSIVFASNLFNIYKERKGSISTLYRLPRQFIHAWDSCIEEIIQGIQNSATPLDTTKEDIIYNICYVTSNGNEEISKNIANVYKENPSAVIKQKDSPTNKSYIKPIIGFEFANNLIDEAYARNEDLSVEEKDITTIVFDHKIDTDTCEKFIIPLNEVLKASNKKLLVIAPYYDALLCNTVLKRYMNIEYQKYGSLNLIMTQYNLGKIKEDELKDLTTILRCITVTEDMVKELNEIDSNGSLDRFIEDIEDPSHPYYRLLGKADQATLSCNNGSIFRVHNIEEDKRYQEVLQSAYAELKRAKSEVSEERQSYAHKIFEANARITQLEMKNYIYYIGADSALQKKITWDSVEDVIKCVRSATKHGIVPGCQITIARICGELIEKYIGTEDEESLSNEVKLKIGILWMIQIACAVTYSQVLEGPDKLGVIKTIPDYQKTPPDKLSDIIRQGKEKVSDIVTTSIAGNKVFDLDTLSYSDKIVTSAETDIMVLLAASELVKILISGNQALYLDSDVNESHQESMDVYV